MADPNPPADPNPADPPLDAEGLPIAKPHQKDKGHIVKTALGEPIPGEIADIADGDEVP
jgi:hypothetical protein